MWYIIGTYHFRKSMQRFGLVLILACLMPLFSGCGVVYDFLFPGDVQRVSVSELKSNVSAPKLRPGLQITVSVSALGQEVFAAQQKEVSAEGDVLLPYVDSVKCEGLTIEQFRQELVKRYSEFYVNPQVSVDYVPVSAGGSSPYGSVLVTGSVAKPGPVSIPPTRDLTVMQALSSAGGATMWADRSAVTLTRELENGERQRVVIDLDDIGNDAAAELNVVLMPGDILHVPESNW